MDFFTFISVCKSFQPITFLGKNPLQKNGGVLLVLIQEETIREAKEKKSTTCISANSQFGNVKFHPKKQTEYFLGIFYPVFT